MIISYEDFCKLLEKHIQKGENFYVNLLETVIDNPTRYSGLFRLSNANIKLIQNITQSVEIKFGDIIEELTSNYILKMGYEILSKDIGKDENNDVLNVDQFFTDGVSLYIVEMKIRDDHDSTKKRGQFLNFLKKINLIRNKYPTKNIKSIMWFVDDSFSKNKNYYQEQIKRLNIRNCEIFLYYGDQFFKILRNGHQSWNEMIELLTKYRENNTNSDIVIPNFGSSEEIYNALLKLDLKHWKKLNSDSAKYVILRKELFSNGENLSRAKIKRENNS